MFVGGGQRLVLGSTALQLKVLPDQYDPQRVRLALTEGGTDRVLPPDSIAGGSMAGLLKFQNEDLGAARALLGQMASAITGRLNEQQALGLDLRQPPGTGAPLLTVGAPRALPADTNTGGSSVALTVMNVRQLQASDYELRADPATAGQYLVTRLSDGLVRSVASGATLDGFQIDVGAPAPAAGDRFLLQPVSQAASSMARVLDDPRGIAAASQVAATVGAANTGTASVASLRTVSTTLDPTLTADIAFTDNAGNYSWTLSNGTSGTGSWSAGTPIAPPT